MLKKTNASEEAFALIDGLPLSDMDKSYLKTSTWTFEETPKIDSASQYESYERVQKELMRQLPVRSDPEWKNAWVQFLRTPAGVLATSLGARMIEWEEEGK